MHWSTDGGSQDLESFCWNSDFTAKMISMSSGSLVVRQAQWNTILQKHTNISWKSIYISCYLHKVSYKFVSPPHDSGFKNSLSIQDLYVIGLQVLNLP